MAEVTITLRDEPTDDGKGSIVYVGGGSVPPLPKLEADTTAAQYYGLRAVEWIDAKIKEGGGKKFWHRHGRAGSLCGDCAEEEDKPC